VYSCDEIPVGVGHVLEADVAKDTCIVDENIDATESLNGGLHDFLATDDVVIIGDSLSTGCLDLVHH